MVNVNLIRFYVIILVSTQEKTMSKLGNFLYVWSGRRAEFINAALMISKAIEYGCKGYAPAKGSVAELWGLLGFADYANRVTAYSDDTFVTRFNYVKQRLNVMGFTGKRKADLKGLVKVPFNLSSNLRDQDVSAIQNLLDLSIDNWRKIEQRRADLLK